MQATFTARNYPAWLMQTALFITDCSVDDALLLRTWLANNAHRPLRLTVVHPYDIPAGEPLHKSVCKPAKTEARVRLNRWTDMLGEADTTYLTTEVLFASSELALTIHQQIRGYDRVVNPAEQFACLA